LAFAVLVDLTMKVAVPVNDRTEAGAVRDAWADPTLRVTVIIVGLLRSLPLAARRRVLAYVTDAVTLPAAAPVTAPKDDACPGD
jgi:hypothetical protein